MTKNTENTYKYRKNYGIKQYCFDFDHELMKEFDKVCKRNRLSRTEAFRRLMKQYIKENSQEVG